MVMTKLTWTISVKVNDSFTLSLNSTIFHTLNTSGVAPQVSGNIPFEMQTVTIFSNIHDFLEKVYPPVGPPALPGGGFYHNATNSRELDVFDFCEWEIWK